MLETDASDHAIGVVLLQHASSEGSPLLPVAFYSKKLNAIEQKYLVHDHEILAIIKACSKIALLPDQQRGCGIHQTTNLSSTYKCNPNSMPARCIGWVLWLTIGWMFAIGQARPTLFQIPCQGRYVAPLWHHWGQPKLLLWAVWVHHRLLANRPIHWSWHHWSGWAPLLLSLNGWGKCMRRKLTLLIARWLRFKWMPQVKCKVQDSASA